MNFKIKTFIYLSVIHLGLNLAFWSFSNYKWLIIGWIAAFIHSSCLMAQSQLVLSPSKQASLLAFSFILKVLTLGVIFYLAGQVGWSFSLKILCLFLVQLLIFVISIKKSSNT